MTDTDPQDCFPLASDKIKNRVSKISYIELDDQQLKLNGPMVLMPIEDERVKSILDIPSQWHYKPYLNLFLFICLESTTEVYNERKKELFKWISKMEEQCQSWLILYIFSPGKDSIGGIKSTSLDFIFGKKDNSQTIEQDLKNQFG